MLEAEHFSGASKSGLHFVGNEERAILAAKFLRPRKEIRPRGLAALALNGLDHERGHVTCAKLSIQFIDVVERHPRIETLHQRTESFGETFAAHQRKRTETESVECTGERDRAFSSSRGPGKFQRALHRFRAGVAKENRVEVRRCSPGDRFGEQSAQERTVHLHHVGKIEVEHVANRLLHHRMVPADIENAVAAQKIEIRNIIHVVEIRALGPGIDLVEADNALGRNEGAVQMPLVQFVIFAQSRRDDLFQIKSHQAQSFRDLRGKRKSVDRPRWNAISERVGNITRLRGSILTSSSDSSIHPATSRSEPELALRLLDPPATKKPQDRETLRLSVNYRLSI
jgi:hypothetical protein